MRILWCHPNAWSGEYSMVARIAQLGHEVCVLQGDRKLRSARAYKEYFRDTEDQIRTLWYNPSNGLEKGLTWPLDRLVRRSPYRGNVGHRMWMIKAAVNYFQPDLIYCSEGSGYAIAAALLKKTAILREPLVVQFIGGDVMDEPAADVGTRRTPAMHWLFRQVMDQADLLKPVSPLLADILQKEGALVDKIRVIPSHLVVPRLDLMSYQLNRNELRIRARDRYGLSANSPVIVSLSGNWRGKGTHLIAQAWGDIRERVPGCCWLVGGPQSDWYTQKVKPLIEKYPGEIIPVGVLTGREVFEFLAAADLHVNPTLADGLNMATVEAAALGVPSLVTDKAGIADWIYPFAHQMVLKAGEESALAIAIGDYFKITESARLILSEKFIAMSNCFDLDRLSDKIIRVFDEALALRKLCTSNRHAG